ncbi:MAG TPA: adenosine deaminase [Terriglobales bacterium]|nr:adenosine deaminase [Terriglobales bacterium]
MSSGQQITFDYKLAPPSPFVLSLPKAELHLHLEGSVEPATLLELRQRHGMPGASLAEVEPVYEYHDFNGFLMAFKAITEHLQKPEDWELITYRLMQRLRSENVLHSEVYVSVGVCHWQGKDFDSIFEALERGRAQGERDFGVSLLWIFDATRHFGPERAQHVAETAAQYRGRNVVAFGIGGDERRAGPELFRDTFAFARDRGLHVVAHAGETTGPESIWGAMNLKAERIGHGLSAWYDRELMAELAQRQIPVEMSITSNLRTGCCRTLQEHPLKMYFDTGVMVTLNSDDPGIFGTSLGREYQLAQDAFGFTNEQLRELARNSFEASFLPAEKKLAFLNAVDAVSADL